ncbi:hypothetical protein [Mesoterricola sediminis]|uniref:Uncharacterized protein n=1 Tax=Mesoterricola sediminis TaxID=2927980 RepID=A0AA48KCC3_9BACT|nr:hypothetical protein [Mesoterricola sediminis]BDU76896.1 hypothetical protein METESE_18540 [Mesoterricola sediminis]
MPPPTFSEHLRQTWPLSAIAAGLAGYLILVLGKGVFYTNQGPVRRDRDPEGYRRWVRRFSLLLALCVATVLLTFLLARA